MAFTIPNDAFLANLCPQLIKRLDGGGYTPLLSDKLQAPSDHEADKRAN